MTTETATQSDDAPDSRGARGLARLDPRALRRADLRIFSSESNAPRARRPTDVLLLIVSALGLILLSFPAPGPTAIDGSVTALVDELPGLFGWFWEISYDLLIGWAILLLLLALFARGRKTLVLHELLAGAVALGLGVLIGRLAGTVPSTSFKALASSGGPPVYLAVRLAIATAVVVVASPHMSRPFRFVGRWVVWFGALAGIALGVTLPVGVAAGFLVGLASGAIVHLVFGSPAGRLSLGQIATALADLGVEATDVRHAPLEPGGVALSLAATPDGRSLLVKVYGRDAWDGQLLTSAWSSLWRRGESVRVGAGSLQQVEHEAFVTMLAERGGVPVLPLVAAGMATGRDALLVTEVTGHRFGAVDPDTIDDGFLRQVWTAAELLHGQRIAHGHLDAYRVVVRPDGSPAFGDFARGRVAVADSAIQSDRAQLLVTTALAVGPDRAVSAALAVVGKDAFAGVLPFLQPAVLDRETRRVLRERDWSMDDLMKRAADGVGGEPPELEQLRRVTVRSIVILALIAFLAYTLISALAGIGIQNLIDEFQSADMAWLIAALLLSPVAQVPQAFSTIGASVREVLFVPSLMLQYAVQFIALAVPSSAARVALEVRFFQRIGVDAGGALSIGLIDSLSGFVIQILLILVITISGLASLDLSSVTSSSGSSSSSGSTSVLTKLLILAVVLLVLGAILAIVVPRYRAMVKEAVPRYRAQLRAQLSSGAEALRVLRSPLKLAFLFGGNLVAQIMLAIILGLCLRAFGEQESLAALILVNTFVSLFAGFMPVPGGMGVAEAGYTAGLMALGVSNTAAVSTALAFRLVTFYLPPIWGSFGMRWLRRHSYL